MLPLSYFFVLLFFVMAVSFVCGATFARTRLRVPSDREIKRIFHAVSLNDRNAPGHLAPRAEREAVRNELARRGFRWAPLDLKKRLGQR